MDAKKTADTGPHMPMNVVENILKRLPAKSVARFSTVCKQWHSLIQTSYFGRMQWDYGTRRSKMYVVNTWLAKDDDSGQNSLCIYSFSEAGGRVTLSDKFAIPVEVKDDFNISNTCHGLISLYGARYIFVANPRIKKFRALKEPSFHQPRVHGGGLFFCNVGLGFSVEAGEYKVVRVSGEEQRCEVLTLRKDHSWRDIGAVQIPLSRHKPAFVNGALYWTAAEHHSGLQRIVRFDVSKEEFTGIRIPPSWLLRPSIADRHLHFGVFWGYLCLVVWCAPRLNLHVIDDNNSTWAGKSGNARVSTIGACLDMRCINRVDYIDLMDAVAVRRGKILMFCEVSLDWVYHDLRRNATSFIRLPDTEPSLRTNSRPFDCEESLIPPP